MGFIFLITARAKQRRGICRLRWLAAMQGAHRFTTAGVAVEGKEKTLNILAVLSKPSKVKSDG
jgi:hypothetical protein